MKVSDVMTRKVISIEANATVLKAARLMLHSKISGLPVVDDTGKLVGIVTEGDFMRRAETGTRKRRTLWRDLLFGSGWLAREYVATHARRVSDVMTHDPVIVAEGAPLADVVELMEKRGIKRVPVMRGNQLVGIVSRSNLLRGLVATAGGTSSGDDESIRKRLTAELEGEAWAPLGTIQIIVRSGVVHLWGAILNEDARKALIVAAENTPGVKEVRDHLAWIEPMSGVVIAAEEMQANLPKAS